MARIETGIMQTRDPLMDTLRQRLGALLAMDLPAPAKDAVRDMLTLTEGHVAPAKDTIDWQTFDGLIKLAGPSAAHDLLAQLDRDLATVEQGMTTALSVGGTKAVRQHTHVLIALAGSVGATELYELALSLNTVAHRPDPTDLIPLGQKLLHGTAQLRAFVRKQMAAMPPQPTPVAHHDKTGASRP